MIKDTLEIAIPEQLRNNIQKVDLEYQSRRNIIIYIMENNINIPELQLKKYQRECDEKFNSFERYKALIERDYVIPNLPDKNNKYTWSLNYNTSILTIKIYDDTI